jgi:hypothetical protein
MSKIIYHYGTGTYFDLEDYTFVIDTEQLEGEDIDDLLDAYGQEIAMGFGEVIVGYITDVETVVFDKE